MPELVIDDEPTVVLLVCPLLDVGRFAGVLCVILLHEGAESRSDTRGVDAGWYCFSSRIEEVDGLGTDIAVNENDACGGLTDERLDEGFSLGVSQIVTPLWISVR